MKHPFTGEEMVRVPRVCPIPGIDLAFGDAVVWGGKAWVINSMHYMGEDGQTPTASLVRYGDDKTQPIEAFAPFTELRVFKDAEPYQLP